MLLIQCAAILPLVLQRLLDPLLLTFLIGVLATLGAIAWLVITKTPDVDEPPNTNPPTGEER